MPGRLDDGGHRPFGRVGRNRLCSTSTHELQRRHVVAIEGDDLGRVVGSTRFVDNERNVETRGVYVPPRGPSF